MIQFVQNFPGLEQLKASYYRALFDSGQDAKAAEVRFQINNYQSGI